MVETIVVSLVVSFLVAFFVSRTGSHQKHLSIVQDGVTTKKLSITDEFGKPRLVFLAGNEGSQIAATDQSGNIRFILQIDETMAYLRFNDALQNPRAVLGAYKDGGKIEFAGQDGKLRALVGEDKADTGMKSSGLKVFNDKGDLRAELVFDDTIPELGPCLTMFDDKLNPRLVTQVSKPGPWMSLLSDEGKAVANLVVVGELPLLALYHPNELGDANSAFELVRKAVTESKSQDEINEIVRGHVAEREKTSTLEKSILIFPGFDLAKGKSAG